jgi:hypothetical protein
VRHQCPASVCFLCGLCCGNWNGATCLEILFSGGFSGALIYTA